MVIASHPLAGGLVTLLGIIILFFVVRWLFQLDDPYNQAVMHHKRLKHLIDCPAEYQAEALKVIQLCQIAIQQKPNHGDAHVVLAMGYFMVATHFLGTEIYDYCLPQAIAVITQWHHRTMYTKNHHNGNMVFQGIMDHIKFMASLGLSLPNTFVPGKDEGLWYTIAINPAKFEVLEQLTMSDKTIKQRARVAIGEIQWNIRLG